MTAPAVRQTIPIRNAWAVREQVRYFVDVLNDWAPWTGGTDLIVRYSQFESGYDFNGYPSTLLGPYAMAETTDPGWYWAPVTADDITAAFGRLVGQTVYQVIEGAYGTYVYGLSTAEPFLISDPRVPL